MAEDARVRVAQEFFQRYFSGDVDRARELLGEDVVYRAPGSHRLSGVFTGTEAVVEHLREFLVVQESPIDVLKWEDWMAGVDYVAALVSVHLQREGIYLEFRLVIVVLVSDAGKIREIDLFYDDQAGFERLFADA
jgi:ketosteroid isomerase-like protein